MPAAGRHRIRIAFTATLCAAVFAGLASGAAAETANAAAPVSDDAMASEVTRIMGREQAALEALASARIEAISEDRLAARSGAAKAVTVTTRNAASEPRTPASAPAVLDFAALDAMAPAAGDAQWQCLAAAIYFESRGEPLAGQIAVAEVVLNRVASRSFPKTICGVTTQGVGSGRGCQFSYACDGHADVMTSAGPKARAEKLARLLIDGRPRTVTDGATHFHATYVRPAWSRQFARTAAIGNHLFYRQGTRVASN